MWYSICSFFFTMQINLFFFSFFAIHFQIFSHIYWYGGQHIHPKRKKGTKMLLLTIQCRCQNVSVAFVHTWRWASINTTEPITICPLWRCDSLYSAFICQHRFLVTICAMTVGEFSTQRDENHATYNNT